MQYWPILLIAFFIVASILVHRRILRRRTGHLATVDAQFRAMRHDNPGDPQLSYDGASAVVVYEHVFPDARSHRSSLDYQRPAVHRVWRNAAGEYFLFISGEPVFVEHLTRERAMNALRADPRAFVREFGNVDSAHG